jgi:hypothetical protein
VKNLLAYLVLVVAVSVLVLFGNFSEASSVQRTPVSVELLGNYRLMTFKPTSKPDVTCFLVVNQGLSCIKDR